MKTFKKFFEMSRQAISNKIAATDVNLTPGSSSKDIRVQPKGDFDPNSFVYNIKSAGLELLRILKPGDPGSTAWVVYASG